MVAIISGKGVGLERSSASVLGMQGLLGSSVLGRGGDNVFVNGANGNLVISRQDEFLIGIGPDVAIARTYNSQATLPDGDNNDNWRASVYRKLTALPGTYGAAGSSVKRIDWDGSDTLYTWNAAENAYVATDGAGAYDTLTRVGSTWTWTDGNSRVTETYDEANGGRLTSTKDADLNSLSYEYTGSLITRVTSHNGEYTVLSYNASSQLTQLVTTKTGGATLTRVRYGYDALNRLSTVTVDLSPDDNLIADGKTYTTTYGYDGASKRVASISQLDGSYVSFTYVLVGADFRVASYTQAVAAGVTRTTGFNYAVPGQTTIIDPTGLQTVLSYNANGELTQIAYPQGAGTTSRTVQFAYLANGDVSSTTFAPGNVVGHTYDAHGNPLTDTDSAGNRVERSYSAKNELLRVTRFLTPTTPVTTRYVYDDESHLVYEVSAEGFVTRHDYNPQGQRTRTTEYPAHFYNVASLNPTDAIAKTTLDGWVPADKSTTKRTDTSYNFRGAIDTVTRWSKVLSTGEFDTGSTSERSQIVHVYDQAGNLLSRVVTGSPGTESFTYDGLGRAVTATDFNNALTRSFFFDSLGQTVVTHANGLSEVTTFNKAGELISFSKSQAGANLIDLGGWPANTDSIPGGQATVPGWMNPSGFTDETRWASTPGPDGVQVVAMQAGQLDASAEGGGNYTHEVQIDGTKAYEFTYYFKLSDRGKHNLYFGLSGTSPATVENLNGTDNTNPYFVVVNTTDQNNYLVTDRWYKAVGYVLPQGAADPGTPLGGVYDTTTGQLVLNGTAFRWNAERPAGNTVHSRFFDYNGETSIQYSTYFYQPEIRQVSAAAITPQGTSTTQYRYDSRGHLRMTIDPTGRRNYMLYDGVGRKVADVDSDGSVTEYRYNASGLLTSSTRWATPLTTAQRDALADFDSWGDGGRSTNTGTTNALVNGSFESTAGGTALAHGYSSATLPSWFKNNPENFEQVLVNNFGVTGVDGNYWLDLDSVPGTGVTTTGSNLVLNPSFDLSGPSPVDLGPSLSNTSLPNWLKNNSHNFEQVKAGQMGVTGYHGSHWLDLDSVPGTGLIGTGSNLLLNGSFETSGPNPVGTGQGFSNVSLPNWTKLNSENFEQVLTNTGGVAATQGSYWLDLDSVPTGVVAVGANLVLNGSFETSAAGYTTLTHGRSSTTLPSWLKDNPENFEQVTSTYFGVTASDGGFWLDLDSVPGTAYTPTGSNLLTNGGFEQSGSYTEIPSGRANTTLPGWTKANPEAFEQVFAEGTTIGPIEGVYWLDLDSVPGSGGTVAGPNLIVNGSFEQSSASYSTTATGRLNTQNLPGWTKTNSGGFEQLNSGVNGTAATDGAFYLDMESTGGVGSKMDISQTVAGMTAGQQLNLRFDFANTAPMVFTGEEYESSGALEVYWNGTLIAMVGSTNTTMITKAYTVTSIAGNNTLRFREIGITDGRGVSIDNVKLYGTVPAPNGGNMDISQIVPNLTAGAMMQLEFSHANRTSSGSGSFEVWWNSNLIATINTTGTTVQKLYQVAAIAGSNTLRFKGTGTVDALGASIDNVRLYATTAEVGGGNMDIYQIIPSLTAGAVMKLQFNHANRTSAASGSFEVWWNSTKLETITSTGTAMAAKSYDVIALGGSNTLRFKAIGTVDAAGASIDNVRLQATQPVGGGNMDVRQTVSGLTAGAMYQLLFDHANRAPAGSGSFEVWWNGTKLETITHTGTAMQPKSYFVPAAAGDNYVRFVGLGTVDALGASIDNVRLLATTTPVGGGNMDVYQTINGLNAGQLYQLQFDHANRAAAGSGDFDVYWNGNLLPPVSYSGTVMQTMTHMVTAAAGGNTIRFVGKGTVDAVGASIDNVRLLATLPVTGGGNMDVGQTVSGLTAGQVMKLQFNHANRTSAASGSFEVWWNNALVDTITETGTAMQTKTYLVSAVAGGNTLRFKGTGTVDAVGASIDNVRLFSTSAGTVGSTGAKLADVRPGGLAEDVWTWNVYDAASRLVETIDGTGAASVIAYDGASRIVSTTQYFNRIVSGTVDTFKSTTPTSVTTPNPDPGRDRVARNFYDKDGRLTGTLDGEGYLTKIVYDLAGQKVRTIAYSDDTNPDYRAAGSWDLLLGSVVPDNAKDIYNHFVYDARGMLRAAVDGEGNLTRYRYTPLGHVDQVITGQKLDPAALLATPPTFANLPAAPAAAVLKTITHARDLYGQTLTETTSLTGGTTTVTSYTYDNMRRLVSTTTQSGGADPRTMTQRYDLRGRLTGEMGGIGNATLPGSPTEAQRNQAYADYGTVHVYDAADRLISSTDPVGARTLYYYDADGRLAYQVNALGEIAEYRYNTLGQRTDVIVYAARIAAATLAGMQGGAAASATSIVNGLANALLDTATHVDFNLDGTVLRSTDTIGVATTFTYNGFGEVATRIDPLDGLATVQTSYSHDRRGLLKTEIVDSVVGGKTITTTYGYDAFGRAIELTNANNYLAKTGYDRAGRVTSTTDPLNNKTWLTYDARGNLVAVKDALNNITRYVYDNAGRRIFAVDALGGVVATTYDDDGRVVMVRAHRIPISTTNFGLEIVTFDINSQLNYAFEDRITRNVYDKDGRLRFVVEDSLLTEHRSLTELRYDDIGNVIRTISYGWAVTGSSYTLADLQAQVTAHDNAGDPKRVQRSVFDAAGRATWSIDGAGGVNALTYDSQGRVIKQVAFATAYGVAGDPSPTTMQSWANANPHLDDRTSRGVYDRKGRLIYGVDPKGLVTEYRYTKFGELKLEIRYAGAYSIGDGATLASVKALLPASIPTTALVTSFFYDRAGRLERTEDTLGRQTTLILDQLGQATSSTLSAPGTTATITTLYEYDELGRVRRETRADGALEEVTTHYGYTALGQISTITHAEGTAYACVTAREYDELGRLKNETLADGHPEETTTAYTYTAFGDVESIAYAAGTVDQSMTKRFYDTRGRLESEVRAFGSDHSTNTMYGYNSFGDVETVRVGAQTMDESVTMRTYDARGSLETETRGDGTISESTTAYAYTAFGELKTLTRASGTIDSSLTTRRYDALGQVVSVRQQVDGDPNHDLVTTNEYDGFGNLVKATDARLNSVYSYYDELGRVELQIDQEGHATKTTYHALLGEAETVTRYAAKLTGPFDVATRPNVPADASKDALTRFEYDQLGRLTAATDAENYVERYNLDLHGNRIKVINKLLGETDYTYDKLNRMKTQFVHGSVHDTEAVLQAAGVRTDYEYDKRGNLKSKNEGANLVWWDARLVTYKYDQLDRLIEIDREDMASHKTLTTPITLTMKDTFVYDRRGNLIEEQLAGGPIRSVYYYDKLDRRTIEVGSIGRLSHWEYDRNGNVRSHRIYGDYVTPPATGWSPAPNPIDPNNFRETRFSYDKADRLQNTRGPALITGRWNGASYAFDAVAAEIVRNLEYDAAGNVIREYVGDVETRSFYDKLGRKIGQLDAEGYMTVWERDGEGNVLKETRHAKKVTGAVAQNLTAAQLNAIPEPSADNRVTEFTYDRDGRRKTEKRLAVLASTVTGLGGTLDTTTVASEIRYFYNGFGQVTRRIEANNDETIFTYDNIGRLTGTQSPSFSDHLETIVTPTTANLYDGFGGIVRATVNAASANARATRYFYNGMGWLETVIDAEGGMHNYVYNGFGKVVGDKYSRTKADGTTTNEALAYFYDAYGQLTGQLAATRLTGGPNPTYTSGDRTNFSYNVYGDLVGRGAATDAQGALAYQETFDYDSAGRLWRTTEGDGTVKIMFRDKLGNATLTLSSTGADLRTLTFTNARDSIDGAGDTNIDNAVTTVAAFDKRGQQTATIEPDRKVSAAAAAGTITRSTAYNAFGEAISETDARSNRTDFFYNTMGRMVRKESPLVSWTSDTGALTNQQPIEHYAYDVSGRLVAVTDAHNRTSRRTLLAGTGHGGEEALVTAEFHADNRKAQMLYDVFGDARIQRNEYWVDGITNDRTKTDTLLAYDKLSRLVETQHLGRLLTETYTYDVLGRRTRHTMIRADNPNNLTEYTEYDRQGRVAKHTAFGGDITTYTYSWNGGLATSGLGTFGAWVKTTVNAATVDATETQDYFGHTIARTDFSDRPYNFNFDLGGRVVSQISMGETLTYSYLNTGRLSLVSNGIGSSTAYGYDAAGNLTSELTIKGTQQAQNATATYDVLDRMTSWVEAGGATSPAASLAIEYDLVGNIRRKNSTFRRLDLNGVASSLVTAVDNWYRYDVMNRVVTEDGFLSAVDGQGQTIYGDQARGIGTIKRHVPGPLPSLNVGKSVGADFTYDEAGKRKSMAITRVRFEGGSFAPTAYFREQNEMYDYAADGHMSQTRVALGSEVIGMNTPVPVAAGSGVLLSSFTRDAMGRVTRQTDWSPFGSTYYKSYERYDIHYNDKGQVADEKVAIRRGTGGNELHVTEVINNFGSGTGYAMGAVTSSTSVAKKNDIVEANITTTNSFQWWDGAVQTSTNIITDNTTIADTNYTTSYYLNETGQLHSAFIGDGRSRWVMLTTDMSGQILRRWETGGTSGNPHEVWYRFGGRQIGFTGNNGTIDTDYSTSAGNRAASGSGAFRFGSPQAIIHTDFGQALDPVNSFSQGGPGGGYTVQAGDTLQSIAANVWGSPGLWFKLAEANGLSAGSILIEGQSLAIPAGVISNAHNADTFKPYDPAKTLGDLSPTTPKPPKKPSNGCGMLGTIIVMAIAIAVTLIIKVPVTGMISGLLTSAGASVATATAVGAIAGAAVTGAIASAVSQGVGVAIGAQEKFSWKGVAIAGISAGVSRGLGQLPGGVGSFLSQDTFISNVAAGATASAITQGISVATGLQKKFSWTGVAVAGISAGVGSLAKGALGDIGVTGTANKMITNAVSKFAGAGARAALTGTSFGDNIMAVLPDVITSTLGIAIEDHLAARAVDRAINRALAEAQPGMTREQIAEQRRQWDRTISERRESLQGADKRNLLLLILGRDADVDASRQLWREYEAGQVPFNRVIEQLYGHQAAYDPSRGENGTISIDQSLWDGRLDPSFGPVARALIAFGDLSEQGHQLEAMLMRRTNRAGFDTPGDEGAMFAYLRVQQLFERSSGHLTLDLGSLGSLQVNRGLLASVADFELSSGHVWRQNQVNGVEHYGLAGHYHTTFLVAYHVIKVGTRNENAAYRIAQELALGSQIPDMFANVDAKNAQISYLLPGGLSEAERNEVQSVLHSLAPPGGAGVAANRRSAGEAVTTALRNRDYVRAGLLIHNLGDSYAHTRVVNGVEVRFGVGWGHFDRRRLLSDAGANMDNMYFDETRKALMRTYVNDLAVRIMEGVVRTGLTPQRRSHILEQGTAPWHALFNLVNNENDFITRAEQAEGQYLSSVRRNYPGARYPNQVSRHRLESTPNEDPQGRFRADLNELLPLWARREERERVVEERRRRRSPY